MQYITVLRLFVTQYKCLILKVFNKLSHLPKKLHKKKIKSNTEKW